MSILVCGDVMLDKHTKGNVSRLSPEAPVPIVNAGPTSKYSLGAAAHVAAQIASADIECFLAYKEYDDEDNSHERLFSMCTERNVRCIPLLFPGIIHPVTTKERVWAGSQQTCRIDREKIDKPDQATEMKWTQKVKQIIEKNNIKGVVFSDYDKGTLTDKIIQSIVDFCKHKNIFTILDPKRFSYWGLQNLTMVKPNRREIKITNMSVENISREMESTYVLNTLGDRGMKLWQDGKHIGTELPYTHCTAVVDVCGCGDTVSAFLAVAFLKDFNIHKSIQAASIGASINARHRGCYILNKEEIIEALKRCE